MKSHNRLKYKPETGFSLIGIACSESILRLSWMLNHSLRLKLQATDSLFIHHEKLETPQEFLMCQHTNLQGSIVYRLIENKSEMGYLSPQYKQFDFILQCMKENEDDLGSLVSILRRENDIGYAAVLREAGKNLIQKLVI